MDMTLIPKVFSQPQTLSNPYRGRTFAGVTFVLVLTVLFVLGLTTKTLWNHGVLSGLYFYGIVAVTIIHSLYFGLIVRQITTGGRGGPSSIRTYFGWKASLAVFCYLLAVLCMFSIISW